MCAIQEQRYRNTNESWYQCLILGIGLRICLNLLFGFCDLFFLVPRLVINTWPTFYQMTLKYGEGFFK